MRLAAASNWRDVRCGMNAGAGSCMEQAQAVPVELAARRQLWWHLNQPYRLIYREHREREEAAAQAAWEAANPDHRSWWDRLLRREPPRYRRTADSPFTCPPLEPSSEQLANLQRLAEVLRSGAEPTSGLAAASNFALELAELYREQGRFGEAEAALSGVDAREAGSVGRLMADLIRERLTAPVRYRL